jgi:GDP-L-fucose synthase
MKRYSEILCETYATKIKNKMKTLIIRPSNLFGEHDDYDFETSHVTAALIRKVAEHQNPIEVWGDGEDVRDILYIGDFVDMTLEASEKIENFTAINIAYGEAYSVKQILDFLLRIENFNPKIIYNLEKPSMLPIRRIDTSRANSIYLKPKIHVMNALSRTLNWYKKEYDYNKNSF